MGVSVLVLGASGSGKSTSLRNFEPGEVAVFDVAGKPLPFRKRLDVAHRPSYGVIMKKLKENSRRAYVIDDANYLMAFQNFALASVKGYDKFTTMAVNFEQLLEASNATDEDTVTYYLMHPEYDADGRMKPKSIGKMLDSQLCTEGMFPIVLVAQRMEDGYRFVTQTDGNTPAKTPMGMFPDVIIDNDLKMVDSAIREYWGMRPLTDNEKKES